MRISDSALVDAAVLSDRYIADRFLPDKAIDLVSESKQPDVTPGKAAWRENQAMA